MHATNHKQWCLLSDNCNCMEVNKNTSYSQLNEMKRNCFTVIKNQSYLYEQKLTVQA